LNLALHAPFGIAGGVQAKVENVLLTVEFDDGTIGYGEAAPLPAYNGETQAQALTVLDGARAWLPGLQLDDWRAAATEFRHRGGATCGSAQCAFETAVLDALARRRGEPLWRFFGGAGVTLETDMTITTGTPEAAAEAARTIVARGFRMVKVKIGGAGPRHDLARLQAIVEAVGDVPLILDGNAGLTRAEADDLVRGLKDSGIAPTLLEQWLPKEDLVGLHDLAEHSGWAVAADESVVTREDALQVAHGQAAQVINVKLMKAGIAVALDVVEVARTAGLGLMIGGNVESVLGMTTSACLAAGLGGFSHADLDTPLFLAENPFVGGLRYDGGTVSVADITAGHGVSPRAEGP
jgi:L-Ala-D/L-Glu epimerase